MLTIDVRARREITHRGYGTVDNHWNRHVHWTQRSWTCVDHCANFSFGRESQRAGNLRQFLCFDFIQFVIATHQQCNQRISAIFNGFNQQGFHRFFDWQIELLNQLSDGFCVWRIDQLHLFGCSRAWC
ncbi:hypothetical protein D3C78_1311600 [compost metagenome]